ncbi:MAG: hypothetical protein AN488_11205 [Anabaena sp. WA113]|nr:MAG: hypothetical protein AN488_11205 [Anabaena sp. WA113]
MIEVLAILSAGTAAGMRIGIPLLIIGILQGDQLWSQMPILSGISPHILIGLFTSLSLFELFASKRLIGQRIIQQVHLFLSPLVGALMGLSVASSVQTPIWLVILIGGLLALVFQLVSVGWFYRLRGLPIWAAFMQDILCVTLVLSAVDDPIKGGLIALILLWLAIISGKYWYDWYKYGREGQRK